MRGTFLVTEEQRTAVSVLQSERFYEKKHHIDSHRWAGELPIVILFYSQDLIL